MMISFEWNNVKFDIVDVGGGILWEDIKGHSHSKNSYELHFIVGGSGTLVTQTQQYRLKKGDFFVTGPYFYHAHKTDVDNPIEDVFIYMQKSADTTKNAVADKLLSKDFYLTENYNISLAQMLLKEYKEKNIDYKSVVAGLTMVILTQLVRFYMPAEINLESDYNNLYDKRFMIIENSFLYNKDITLPQLSKAIGVCPRQTQRLLRKYYNKTFREKKKEQGV